ARPPSSSASPKLRVYLRKALPGRGFDVHSAAGNRRSATCGSVNAATSGTLLIPVACVPRASFSGLKLSAVRATGFHLAPIGMRASLALRSTQLYALVAHH